MDVKYDSLLDEVREGDSGDAAVETHNTDPGAHEGRLPPDTSTVEKGSRLVSTPGGAAWRYGADNTELPSAAGVDINAEPDKLYALVIRPGRTTELYISAGGHSDFDFGVLLVQGGTVGSLVIESDDMQASPLFPDESVPPRFAAANLPPAISTPSTGYMFRFHWDGVGNVLLGNLAYTEEMTV